VIEATKDRRVPVLERLRAFVRSLAVAQNNDFGRCLVLVGARPLESTGSDIRQFQRRLDKTVRDLITEGIAAGTIKPCDPAMFSALLFGALNWVPRWHSETGKFSIPQVADTFMDMLVDGIAARR
jgi:AcrR family transcriptional regulator